MKKYSIHIIFILIGIILVLYFMYCNVYEKYTKVQEAYELLQSEQEALLDDCEQLELKINNLEGLNTDLENRLLAWKESAVTEGGQIFWGGWRASRYYEADKEGIQFCEEGRTIHMQHNYISMTGHHLTEDPIYSVKVRIKGEKVGISVGEGNTGGVSVSVELQI